MGDGTSHTKTAHANTTLTNRSLTVAAQNPPPAATHLRSSVPIRVHPWQKKTARKKHPCKTSVAKLAHTQARAIMGDGTSHTKTAHANTTLTDRSLTVAAQNPPPAAPQLRSSVPIRVHPWQKKPPGKNIPAKHPWQHSPTRRQERLWAMGPATLKQHTPTPH